MPQRVIERYLVIREIPSQAVITVIEVLSHTNKQTQAGRQEYRGSADNS